MKKLAIVATHPIQYYAPWFKQVAEHSGLRLKVFYLWPGAVQPHYDPGFRQTLTWDQPLLEGYEFEFLPNVAARPGTQSFWGLNNPGLVAAIKDYGADAVLVTAYLNFSSFKLSLAGLFTLGRPLLLRGDSHLLGRAPSIFKTLAIKSLLSPYSAALYTGQENKHYFSKYGFQESQLFFCPHSIDQQLFNPSRPELCAQAQALRQSLGLNPDSLVITFSGKFEPKKRPLDLLEAFVKLNQTNTQLLFIGAGELELELKQKSKGLNSVFFTGFLNQSKLPAAYLISDLLVLPSYGPYETWGLVVNEARSMGKAVLLSSHVGSASDLLESGQDGLVFQAGDQFDLYEKLKQACQSKEQLQNWGKQGLKYNSIYNYQQATAGLLASLDHCWSL